MVLWIKKDSKKVTNTTGQVAVGHVLRKLIVVIQDIGNLNQTSPFNQLGLKEEAMQLRLLVSCLLNLQTVCHSDDKVKAAKIMGTYKNKIPGGQASHLSPIRIYSVEDIILLNYITITTARLEENCPNLHKI